MFGCEENKIYYR